MPRQCLLNVIRHANLCLWSAFVQSLQKTTGFANGLTRQIAAPLTLAHLLLSGLLAWPALWLLDTMLAGIVCHTATSFCMCAYTCSCHATGNLNLLVAGIFFGHQLPLHVCHLAARAPPVGAPAATLAIVLDFLRRLARGRGNPGHVCRH